ncbi:DUF2878 domain-containing protein [Shewanella sp.]|nr:DUF2878 domain-containing protein [Shewanella sp.]
MRLASKGKLTTTQLNLANLLIFQAVWWLSILYQNSVLLISSGLLLLHFAISDQSRSDLLSMVKVVACGVIIDALLTYTQLFEFQQTPYWLGLLWCHFAISLRYSLAFTQKLPCYINALLGGVFGCISYLAGARFGAVVLPQTYLTSVMILFGIWFVMFPMFIKISKQR